MSRCWGVFRVLEGDKETLEFGKQKSDASLELDEDLVRALVGRLRRKLASEVCFRKDCVVTLFAHSDVDVDVCGGLFCRQVARWHRHTQCYICRTASERIRANHSATGPAMGATEGVSGELLEAERALCYGCIFFPGHNGLLQCPLTVSKCRRRERP